MELPVVSSPGFLFQFSVHPHLEGKINCSAIFPFPAIPPSHIKTHHIRGAWTTPAPTLREEIYRSILKQRDRIGTIWDARDCWQLLAEKNSRAQNASVVARTAPRRPGSELARASGTLMSSGAQNASGLARTHLRAQNASGLARTQPQTVQTLRMRAG